MNAALSRRPCPTRQQVYVVEPDRGGTTRLTGQIREPVSTGAIPTKDRSVTHFASGETAR